MAAISTYLADKLFNHVLRNEVYTPPAKVYLALYTTDPTAAGTGTEVQGRIHKAGDCFDASASGRRQYSGSRVSRLRMAGDRYPLGA